MTVYSELRAKADEAWQALEVPSRPRIVVGITTCSRAKGADDTLAAIRREIAKRKLAADVVVTGCWGLCYAEPMLEVAKPSGQRVLYQQVSADRVPQLIDEALDGEGICGVLALASVGLTPVQGLAPLESLHGITLQTRRLMANCGFIQPDSRRNEIVSFVKSGLRDLSISRTTFSWGVPVPDAPKHVMYVWVDALSNYITALGYPDMGGEMARWPADVHIIGKDITRFHAIYWPAFLMSAKLALPKRIFGHGFIYSRGEKMSKSVGNVIVPQDLIAAYGLDQIRYFLLREAAFGHDANISHEAVVQRMNSDLANDFGNLAQRVLSFINKNGGAAVPQPAALAPADEALLKAARDLLPALRKDFAEQAFHRALEALWQVIGDANRYVDEQAPWALRKTDPARMNTVLYVLAEVIRHLAILAQPVVPAATAKLLDQLAVPENKRDFVSLGEALRPGTALAKPEGVFPRFVETAGS